MHSSSYLQNEPHIVTTYWFHAPDVFPPSPFHLHPLMACSQACIHTLQIPHLQTSLTSTVYWFADPAVFTSVTSGYPTTIAAVPGASNIQAISGIIEPQLTYKPGQSVCSAAEPCYMRLRVPVYKDVFDAGKVTVGGVDWIIRFGSTVREGCVVGVGKEKTGHSDV